MLLAALVLFTAALAVGITAPADGVFTIDIHPVFLQMDPAAVAASRARALGLDVDIKIGSMHLHFGWSAVSPAGTAEPRSTPPGLG
jgi:hypothetical protein